MTSTRDNLAAASRAQHRAIEHARREAQLNPGTQFAVYMCGSLILFEMVDDQLETRIARHD